MNIVCVVEEKSSGDEGTSSVVKPTKRKAKINPNVHYTKRLMRKEKVGDSDPSSEEEVLSVSYKSKRSAMPDGPQDQGATAILVIISICCCLM